MSGTQLTIGALMKTARKRGRICGLPLLLYAGLRRNDLSGLRQQFFSRALVGYRLVSGRPCSNGGAPTAARSSAAAQTADRIDYRIRCKKFNIVGEPIPLKAKANQLTRAIHVGLSAIGQCLKDQYDALATPMPRHLAALVEQLEMQK